QLLGARLGRVRLVRALSRAELEVPEVLAGDLDRDVVDRHASDEALEGAGVRVAMEDEVGAMRGDRAGEAVAAEERPDPPRLTLQRRRRRRVVEEHDPDVA